MNINVEMDLDYHRALERSHATFTELQRDLLASLAGGEEVAAGLLAPLLGLKHHGQLNLAISGLAKKLAQAGGVDPPKRSDGSRRWWQVVATGRETNGRFYWTMRPALREAVRDRGLVPDLSPIYPDVIDDDHDILTEGAVARVVVNSYERNPVARRRCIAHYGTACMVCGFDFEAVYGSIAAGVIHVHHLQPLATGTGVSRIIDPIQDLRPVCPNCHLVIHRRNPPLSMDEARKLVAETNKRLPISNATQPVP